MPERQPPESPWLTGAVAPVFSERTVRDLEVTGKIPEELLGRFVKIGPNPVHPPTTKKYRAFISDGMVHGVRLRDGKAEWYRNRWVRSRRVSRALGEATVPGPRHHIVDQVNTHVIGHADMTLALIEAGCTPAELSFELDTLRYTDFDGTLPAGFSAHPKLDPRTGELHAVAYRPFRRHVQYIVLSPDAKVTKVVPIRVPATPIMHDMALTPNYVILFDLPARFSSPLRIMRGAVYGWDENYPARFGVLPRDGGSADIRWFEIDPCFILHTVNAHEEGSRIVVEGMRYARVMDETLNESQRPKSHLWRWSIDLATGAVQDEQLDDVYEEFPRINDNLSTLDNRFAYTAGLEEPPGVDTNSLIKRNLATGETELRKYAPGEVPSEPVFVPRPGGTMEDDGWVLTYVTDMRSGTTDFVIFDAHGLTSDPVAVVHLPVRVPTAFHGSWIPDNPSTVRSSV
jgi:carotenoid cleavage dioxygenase-like enzyme